jgi:SpoIID/LytB domain protein
MLFTRRKSKSLLIALSTGLLVGLPMSANRASGAALAPQSFGANVTISGRGSGHGDGLSQWGALGYAVTYNWDWTQILDHYYGGTTRTTTDGNQIVRINLLAMNDTASTTVVQQSGQLATNADGRVGRFTAVVALETAPKTYRVYGRSDVMDCAASPTQAALDAPTSGWRLLNPAFVSVSTGTRLEVAAPTIDVNTTAVATLPGVCRPDGAVRHYRGTVEIMNGTADENRTVNAVPLDPYIRGVVPKESIPAWGDAGGGKGLNALRAQAVAARTYVMTERRASYAQSCDTTQCQMYLGAGVRTSLTAAVVATEDPRTDAGVADTAGVVLVKADGLLAYTQFGAASGGYTSGANFPAVEDLGDSYGGNESNKWSVTRQRSDIEAAFPTVGRLLSIDVIERNGLGEWGGRAKKVRVKGTSGSTTVTGEDFRWALGLKSSWISVPSGCEEGTTVPATAPRTSGFHPLPPTRVVDTRQGLGGSTLEKNCVLAVHVAGVAGVPATASAVALNITAAGTAAPGFLTAYPCDQGRPSASSVNARTETPVANLAIVPVDSRGDVCIFTDPGTDLIVDVSGWFGTAGDGFSSLGPARIVDTRNGVGAPAALVAAGGVLTVDLAATKKLSGRTSAVVMNVTATGSAKAGFLTVYPCGGGVPTASNVNAVAGRDVANEVISAVATDNKVCIYSDQPTHVIVDLLGAFGSGDTFTPIAPSRLLDSRNSTPLNPGETREVPLPAGSTSVAINLTSTRSLAAGFVTAYPCGAAVPDTSNLNVAPGRDTANQVLLRVGARSSICLVSNVTTDIIVDLQGKFGPAV